MTNIRSTLALDEGSLCNQSFELHMQSCREPMLIMSSKTSGRAGSIGVRPTLKQSGIKFTSNRVEGDQSLLRRCQAVSRLRCTSKWDSVTVSRSSWQMAMLHQPTSWHRMDLQHFPLPSHMDGWTFVACLLPLVLTNILMLRQAESAML